MVNGEWWLCINRLERQIVGPIKGDFYSRFTIYHLRFFNLSDAVRHLAAPALLDQLVNLLGRQVLVVVEADLHHRRGAAGAEALDLGERELSVTGRLARLDAEPPRA